MSIIKPIQKAKKVQQRISIDQSILDDIKQYCQYAGFQKFDEFLEEAAVHVLSNE